MTIHVIPLSKCESFEIGGKNIEKSSLLYWCKGAREVRAVCYIGVKGREKEGQCVILV